MLEETEDKRRGRERETEDGKRQERNGSREKTPGTHGDKALEKEGSEREEGMKGISKTIKHGRLTKKKWRSADHETRK